MALNKRLTFLFITFMCVNSAVNQKVTTEYLSICERHYNASWLQIQVTVYYESLCPYSSAFITNQLSPAHEPLADYIDVLFVPFGKSIVSNTLKEFILNLYDYMQADWKQWRELLVSTW